MLTKLIVNGLKTPHPDDHENGNEYKNEKDANQKISSSGSGLIDKAIESTNNDVKSVRGAAQLREFLQYLLKEDEEKTFAGLCRVCEYQQECHLFSFFCFLEYNNNDTTLKGTTSTESIAHGNEGFQNSHQFCNITWIGYELLPCINL